MRIGVACNGHVGVAGGGVAPTAFSSPVSSLDSGVGEQCTPENGAGARECLIGGAPRLADEREFVGLGSTRHPPHIARQAVHAPRPDDRDALPADEREQGKVPGFGNLPAVVAAAASLRAVVAEAEEEAARLGPLVDRIRELGGAARAIEFFQDEIHTAAYEHQLAVERGEVEGTVAPAIDLDQRRRRVNARDCGVGLVQQLVELVRRR